MTDPFIIRLSEFARAVDFPDESTLRRVGDSLFDYFEQGQRACYYEVCIEGPRPIDGGDRDLSVKWCWMADRRDTPARLRDESGIRSIKAWSYVKRQPVWITTRDEDMRLRESPDAFEVHWTTEGRHDLPPYRDYDIEGEARTAVAIPLKARGRVFGVLVAEFARLVPCSPATRDHMQKLSDAVATLLDRFSVAQASSAQTREAFLDMQRGIEWADCGVPSERHPLFLAYSAKADERVLEVIREVLERFADRIDVTDWKSMTDTGSITSAVMEKIRACRFGVCFFSEPSESADGLAYQDNPNVLFEAGMFHVLRGNRADSLNGWLPIREHEDLTGRPPFDFANERLLVVPRTDGQLDAPALQERLERFIESLVAI